MELPHDKARYSRSCLGSQSVTQSAQDPTLLRSTVALYRVPLSRCATPLPGFSLTLTKTATTGPNPFGIWFANATTMSVADQGDAVLGDVSANFE